MFELDIISGAVTCDQFKLSKNLKHDAFIKHYSEFDLLQECHHDWGLTVKTYGATINITSSQTGFLSVTYFNHDIEYIHIDAASNLDFSDDEMETGWWDIQEKWIPIIHNLIHSQIGKPHHIQRAELFDEPDSFRSYAVGKRG